MYIFRAEKPDFGLRLRHKFAKIKHYYVLGSSLLGGLEVRYWSNKLVIACSNHDWVMSQMSFTLIAGCEVCVEKQNGQVAKPKHKTAALLFNH